MQEITSYLSPHQLDDAVKALAEGDVTVVCGGTDLALQTASGQKPYTATLLNIRRIDALAGILLTDDGIRIGALTTVSEIMRDPLLNKLAPVLAEAADQFASDQVRNAASIGGNICNASPAGDMIIPLLVLDASVELASWRGSTAQSRQVPLNKFFTAPGKTVLRENELVTALVFARPAPGFIARFRKPGPRPALEIASVSIGVGGMLSEGVFSDVRVALGAVAPTPFRARQVEAALEGKLLNADSITAAVTCAGEETAPIDDVRASAWYRDHLVQVLMKEVLNNVIEN